MTFLEMTEREESRHSKPEEYLPSEVEKNEADKWGRCPICSSWSFTSKSEKKRHMSLLHRNFNGISQLKSNSGEKRKWVCNHKGCRRKFRTYYMLKKHKKEAGHRRQEKIDFICCWKRN